MTHTTGADYLGGSGGEGAREGGQGGAETQAHGRGLRGPPARLQGMPTLTTLN